MASVLDNIVGGALSSAESAVESSAILAIKNLLLTRQGATGSFDPVWKMTDASVVDPNTGSMGNPAQTVAGDPGGANAPKLKFNYTVEFSFNQAITTLLQASNASTGADPRLGSQYMDKMAFQVKTASRPSPSVVFQDVNFYNYRTKVAVKVDYGMCTITFYDDVQNWAHDIYRLYLQTISPIANVQSTIWGSNFDGVGVNPQNGDPSVSSLGALPVGEENGLISSITVVHQLPLNYDPAITGVTATAKSQPGLLSSLLTTLNPFQVPNVNTSVGGIDFDSSLIQANTVQYVYMNPKIINFNLDDLDMTQSDVSTVSLTFTYDTVYISTIPIAFDLANAANAGILSPTGAGTASSLLSSLGTQAISGAVTGAATSAIASVL